MIFRAIYYASKTFNETQENYSRIEKEMLAMVFACEKFKPYILGSHAGLEVDQAKISLIKTLIPLTTVKRISSFLRHAGFYRRFILDFSKIARPLCRLLEKDPNFEFDEACSSAFEEIMTKLVISPIMATPDWSKEFEIMCDASNYAMGAVFGVEKRDDIQSHLLCH